MTEVGDICGIARGESVRFACRVFHGPVRLGDVFTTLYKYELVGEFRYDTENVLKKTGGQQVCILVKRITTLGHEFTEAEEGITTVLEVEGRGTELLEDGMTLGNE